MRYRIYKMGGRKMRTLEEIRQKNKKKDLLLDGMESKPVNLPQDLQTCEKELYKNFIKPHVRNFFVKHLKEGNI